MAKPVTKEQVQQLVELQDLIDEIKGPIIDRVVDVANQFNKAARKGRIYRDDGDIKLSLDNKTNQVGITVISFESEGTTESFEGWFPLDWISDQVALKQACDDAERDYARKELENVESRRRVMQQNLAQLDNREQELKAKLHELG